MARKIKDIVIKVGEYQDRNTGETKARFENVGAIMKTDDGGSFAMLKRTFNPAGVPNPDGRDSVLLSFFDPKPRDGGQQRPPQNNGSAQYAGASHGGQPTPPPPSDDDLPF